MLLKDVNKIRTNPIDRKREKEIINILRKHKQRNLEYEYESEGLLAALTTTIKIANGRIVEVRRITKPKETYWFR